MEAIFLETQAIAIIKNLPRSHSPKDEEETLKALALRITKTLTDFLGYEVRVIVSSVNYDLILQGINFFNAKVIEKLKTFFRESISHEVEIIIPQARRRIICS